MGRSVVDVLGRLLRRGIGYTASRRGEKGEEWKRAVAEDADSDVADEQRFPSKELPEEKARDGKRGKLAALENRSLVHEEEVLEIPKSDFWVQGCSRISILGAKILPNGPRSGSPGRKVLPGER